MVLPERTQEDYNQAKKECGGFHLMNNAFWHCNDFDLHQQIMRCSMHTIDLGIIKTILTGCIDKLNEVLLFNGFMTVLTLHYDDINIHCYDIMTTLYY